jgi:hypothetical protein
VLDPASLESSITECSACHQPIALPRSGEPASCAYCGATAPPAAPLPPAEPEGPYRNRPRTSEGALLPFDLRLVPERLRDLGVRPGKAKLAVLRRAWEERKRALAGPHPIEDEFDAAWLAVNLARIYGATGDAIRERAVLEAALARFTVPAYRALMLARLARAAALAGRFELADRWLEQVPGTSRIAEVDSDVLVARALLLLRGERLSEVLALLGDNDEGSPIAGLSRPFGDLVRIDALERSGKRWAAYNLYRKAIRVHGAFALQDLVTYYGLARQARRITVTIGFIAIAAIVALLAAAWRLATGR